MVQHDKYTPQDPDAKKERGQTDAKGSTVKAQPKKDGQGNSYTWNGQKNPGEEEMNFQQHDPSNMMLNNKFNMNGNNSNSNSPTNSPETSGLNKQESFKYKKEEFPQLGSGPGKDSPSKQKQVDQWKMDIIMDKELRG